jgi:carbon-monoxide dehydrogenase small subunit
MINDKENASVRFFLNGIRYNQDVPISWTLLRLLRDGLGFYGVKCGCEIGECGACTILMDGSPVNACLILAPQIDGANLWTIEGVADCGIGALHSIQKAFIECDAVHCGFCSPGMVMATIGLFLENDNPGEIEIKQALAGNLCRCTGYVQIIDAVKRAAFHMTEKDLEKFRFSHFEGKR